MEQHMRTSSEAVGRLADDLYQVALDRAPLELTLSGIRDRDAQLTDYSEPGEDTTRGRLLAIVDRAKAIEPSGLTAAEQVNRSVIEQMAESFADNLSTREVEYAITDSLFAPAIRLLSLLPLVSITEPQHADAYLARLARVPKALADIADRHRAGIAAGRTPVRRLVEATVAHLDRHLAAPDDPLTKTPPSSDTSVDIAQFVAERDRLAAEEIRPALTRYRDMLAAEVAPHGRPEDRPGLCWLPAGEEHYAALVRVHTTTDRDPADLHRTGLSLIESLAAEYAEVGGRLFNTTGVGEIQARLRTDASLRWSDGDAMIAAAREAIDRAERAAGSWFGVLPSQGCTVEPVPDHEAPGAPAAYYRSPALDGSRPGIYYINTHEADQRGRATYEAVAFHEAVPGHHFQLTRQRELTELPLVRRLGGFTAYSEGWGLYAERLADEMGLYSGDLARLGMLSEDSMRAARLVVDTGLHAMGWSRAQVVDFLLANTATPAVEVEAEADRYIAAPGQALSYMVGRLEIQRIRASAEQRLGAQFDIRAFHDTVLGSGALPLTVLDQVVSDWATDRPGQG
jgi:uncharacterized protein (DUF885 family)